jgi:hypothetical protein
MIGIYLVAYVGSKRVIDLPLNLVAPETVRNTNEARNSNMTIDNTILVIATN